MRLDELITLCTQKKGRFEGLGRYFLAYTLLDMDKTSISVLPMRTLECYIFNLPSREEVNLRFSCKSKNSGWTKVVFSDLHSYVAIRKSPLHTEMVVSNCPFSVFF